MSPRRLVSALLLLVAGAFIPGCRPLRPTDGGTRAALLSARPDSSARPDISLRTRTSARPASTPALDGEALFRIPAFTQGSPEPSGRLPLLVVLHGDGSDAAGGMSLLAPLADEYGVVLLAPSSRSGTWDAIRGGYEADVLHINTALEETFAAVRIDPGRISVAGFSDGASYALGLGLANGDLFTRIIAFSPGFIPGGPRRGSPAFFISHGTCDDVLPLHVTARKIAPALERDGYPVTHREFDGGHTVPLHIAREALAWLGW
ncbi:PHB depolymerase family esterase [Arthrobacter sp. UYP6]|uniref:alpha/beta hydrolase n=1 Tax=Arthrobacter sp. UYP6 TaxID=1756378 RepID=UPI0033928D55